MSILLRLFTCFPSETLSSHIQQPPQCRSLGQGFIQKYFHKRLKDPGMIFEDWGSQKSKNYSLEKSNGDQPFWLVGQNHDQKILEG